MWYDERLCPAEESATVEGVADGCIAKSLVVSLAVEQSSVMQVAKLRFEPLKRADAIAGR